MFAVVDDGLHRSPAFLGVLDLGFGAGSVVGGLLAGTVLRRLGAGHAVTAGLAAVAVGIAPGRGPGGGGRGARPGDRRAWACRRWWPGMSTTLQRLTPTHLQGRTFSAVDVLVSAPQSLSIALGAALVAVVDFRILVAAMTVGILLAAAWLGTRPGAAARAGPDGSRAGAAPLAGTVQPAPGPEVSLPAPLPGSLRLGNWSRTGTGCRDRDRAGVRPMKSGLARNSRTVRSRPYRRRSQR